MTKRVDETLKKTNMEKKKTSLRISKKNNSKPTKRVVLEAPILEQSAEKKVKRTISRKKPIQKSIGSLSNVQKQEVINPKKKKSNTTLKPNTPVPNSQKNSQLLNTKQILVKPKRTLKLNINNNNNNNSKLSSEEKEKINSIIDFDDVSIIESSPIPSKKEVSINQNSAFFYEPSIFQKFNIEVSSADDYIEDDEGKNDIADEVVEKETEVLDPKQQFIENATDEYDFISTETPDIYKPGFSFNEEQLENSENLSSSTTEEIDENITLEKLDDTTNTTNDEISIDDIDITDISLEDIEAIEKADTNEISTNNMDVTSTSLEDTEAIEKADTNEISTNNMDITSTSLEDTEAIKKADTNEDSNNIIAVDFTVTEEAEKQEVADNLITNEILEESQKVTNSDDTAIGKFFDSSIPTINQSNDNSYFKKIKKSLFSNISTVFKKFSYEEASLINSEKETLEEVSPILGLTPQSTTSDIKQVLENFDNNKENIINNIEVSAESNTLVIPTVDDKILEQQNESAEPTQDIFTNIVTPQSDNETPSVSLDDTEIDDASNKEISDVLDYKNSEPLSDEDIDDELNEVLGIVPENEEEDHFSIEEYFGITTNQEDEEENDDEEDEDENIEDDYSDEVVEENDNSSSELESYQEQMQSFSKIIENFTQTISTLSNKINELETNISSQNAIEANGKNIETSKDEPTQEEISKEETLEPSKEEPVQEEISKEKTLESQEKEEHTEETNTENIVSNEDTTTLDLEDIKLEDISLDDISLDDINLEDLESLDNLSNEEEPSLLPTEETSEDEKSVEDILLEAFDNKEIDDQMKQDLLSEVLSVEESIPETKTTEVPVETENTSDFFKVIDSLSKTISELEKAPGIVENNISQDSSVTSSKKIEEVAPVPENTSDKAINILINKDDIFSIAILNETYEIVTDFDGISVLSENIHISTPKNNFYVNIGDKYIEIHKQPDLFVVNTNFEDIEFANAINNVTFAKKKNKIELNIKEAFKISSVNKKIELSMLNTSIANLAGAQEKTDSDSSICDNKTLVINEETQKVYLPYTIEEVMQKLNNSSEYQSLEDVIEQEYTLPLSTFKMPIISRFKEAYRFMRTKEKSSVYAALDLAVELMFNSNLNPAVIRASKDLKELNIYLDCLYENEIEKFDCFKVIYKVLPKIQ